MGNKKKDIATETWFNGLTESTRKTYRSYWKMFTEYTKMNGDQLLADKKAEGNGKYKGLLFQFREHLKGKGLSDHSARTACGCVRGFFGYHETPIILRRTERARLRRVRRKRMDYKFNQENLSKIAMVSGLMEKYVVIVGKSLGLRASDFVKLTYGDFRALDLTQEPPVSMGELSTLKEGIPSFPLLDSDSVPIIQQVLDSHPDAANNETILTIRKTELTVILQRLTRKANVQTGDKHVRFHCLRKFLTDRLSAVMSESKWKQIIGKKISESEYVSEEFLREAYAKAMKNITVMNNARTSTKMEELENENKTLRTILISLIGRERIEKAIGKQTLAGAYGSSKDRKELMTDTELLELYAQTLTK